MNNSARNGASLSRPRSVFPFVREFLRRDDALSIDHDLSIIRPAAKQILRSEQFRSEWSIAFTAAIGFSVCARILKTRRRSQHRSRFVYHPSSRQTNLVCPTDVKSYSAKDSPRHVVHM